MFKAIKAFFVDKPIEDRVKNFDADSDAYSVKNAILWNIAKLAIDANADLVRLTLNPSLNNISVENRIKDEWKQVAELPAEPSYLQGIRFFTNSKMISDRRLPIGEATVKIDLDPAVYEVKMSRDESHPVNLLEFTVRKVQA